MIHRRRMLSYALALPALSQLTISCANRPANNRLISALSRTVTRQRTSIRDAANLLADTLIARNRCFFRTGNTALMRCVTENTFTLPPVFIPLLSTEMAKTIRAGDTLLTTADDPITMIARDREAHIIIIGAQSDTIPTADICIPFESGHVSPAECSFLAGSFLTAIAGETYRRSAGIGLTSAVNIPAAADFIGILNERIGTLADNSQLFEAASADIAASISDGGNVRVYAHPGSLVSDTIGAHAEHVIFVSRKQLLTDGLSPHDTLICVALQSALPSDMLLLRTPGMVVRPITICPVSNDESGGFRLYNGASYAFDNMSHDTAGIIRFDSGKRTFLSTAPLMNTAIFLSLLSRIAS